MLVIGPINRLNQPEGLGRRGVKPPPNQTMVFVQTHNRWEAIEVFINQWLKDQTPYCNYCGSDYDPRFFPCCESPQVGRNMDHTYGLIKQNREMQKIARNELATNETRTARWGVSIPPRLFEALDKYVKSVEGEQSKLFKTKEDIRNFARKFPAFRIPEKL